MIWTNFVRGDKRVMIINRHMWQVTSLDHAVQYSAVGVGVWGSVVEEEIDNDTVHVLRRENSSFLLKNLDF